MVRFAGLSWNMLTIYIADEFLVHPSCRYMLRYNPAIEAAQALLQEVHCSPSRCCHACADCRQQDASGVVIDRPMHARRSDDPRPPSLGAITAHVRPLHLSSVETRSLCEL